MSDEDRKLDLDSLDQLLEDAELMQLTGGTPVDAQSPQSTPAPTRAADVPPPPPPTQVPTPAPTMPPPAPAKSAEASRVDAPTLEAERPRATQKKATNDSKQDAWTEEEMDGIKKLVIIFGSSILVVSLAAVGIALGSLFKSAKTSPEVITALEETKVGVEETYKLAESNNREIKELGQRITEVITQLSDTEAVMNDIKAINEEQLQHAVATPAVSAVPKKSVATAESLSPAESISVKPVSSVPSASMGSNDPQVMSLSADMKDIKRRLAVNYKALESLQKQSIGLQSQSQELMNVIKTVEAELKSRKAVKSTVNTVKPVPARTSKPMEESYPTSYRDEQTYRPAQAKPVDDAGARMRWQQQMDKTDSFP